MVRVRFAPSPTGSLHIGGARTALFNYLIAKKLGGTFILRIDDTDKERSTKEFEEEIISSLHWLGLSWDEGPYLPVEGPHAPYRQSERLNRHRQAAEEMLANGSAYMDHEGVARIRYPSEDIVVEDIVCGDCRFAPTSLGPEPVILRSDGTPTYHLASVMDDIDMGITHIIRGQDHLTNTAKHVVLFRAAGSQVPRFAHLPLILGEDGSKLSKRNSTGYVTVSDFKKAGYLPEALINFVALLGWSHPEGKERFTVSDAVESFTLERVGHTGARFELSKLNWYNAHYLRELPDETLAELTLPWTGEYQELIKAKGEAYWQGLISALKTDIEVLPDVEHVARLVSDLDLPLDDEARTFLDASETKGPFEQVLEAWHEAVETTELEADRDALTKEQVQHVLKKIKKGVTFSPKIVFQSIRILVTGKIKGPELDVLLPYVSRDVLRERVRSIRSQLN